MAAKEAKNPINAATSVWVMCRTSSIALKQSTFNCKVADKYQGLWIFEIEINNIFMTISCNIQFNEKTPIILKCLGTNGSQFVETLNGEEQEQCKTNVGIFEVDNLLVT